MEYDACHGRGLSAKRSDCHALLCRYLKGNVSGSRKIHNWVSGKNRPAARDDIFRIAFALQLNEQQLNYLLCLCTDYCIQYRDNQELILTWFLRSGYSYQDAMEFYSTLPPVQELNLARTKQTSRLTHEVRAAFQHVHTLDDLRDCYLKNLNHFGAMHLRAYYYFDKFLNQFIHPTPCWDSNTEPDYSLEAVMQTYLTLKVPSGILTIHTGSLPNTISPPLIGYVCPCKAPATHCTARCPCPGIAPFPPLPV